MPEPDLPNLEDDLTLMVEAAREAGELAETYLPQVHQGNQVWSKDDATPVTEADLAVNRLLQNCLSDARPEYGWLSEETADDPPVRKRRRVWVVDPIDGTRAFARVNDPYWCIAIAIVEDGRAVAGVLFAPELNELFEARIGNGAYLNREPISASGMAVEQGARLVTNQAMIDHPGWPIPWPDVEVCEPKPNATLYRMALVATGKWDAALALTRKSDWDLAAGAVIVSEAGGIAGTHAGEAFAFNREVPAQRSLLAAAPKLYPLLVERIRHVDLADPNA